MQQAGVSIESPAEVMTVDECLAIVPRAVFAGRQFDEQLCDGWHLYVVDYCLRVKAAGLKAYVLPAVVHHASGGRLGLAYFKALGKVLRRYRDEYACIKSTCGCWDTHTPIFFQWLSFSIKKKFYGFTGRLIASGLVPEWMQRKKKKRLQQLNQQH
jgi:hypothetical protein